MRVFRAYATLTRALLRAFTTPRVRALLLVCLMIALTQAVVFRQLEGWSFLDAFYFAVVSMATVGYGDLAPQTALGKISAIGFLIVGIGIFVLTVSSIAQIVLGELVEWERREKGMSPETTPDVEPPRPAQEQGDR